MATIKELNERAERGTPKHSALVIATNCTREMLPLAEAIEHAINIHIATEREACAKVLENGSFLHDQAPTKLFATEAAAAIRRRNDSR